MPPRSATEKEVSRFPQSKLSLSLCTGRKGLHAVVGERQYVDTFLLKPNPSYLLIPLLSPQGVKFVYNTRMFSWSAAGRGWLFLCFFVVFSCVAFHLLLCVCVYAFSNPSPVVNLQKKKKRSNRGWGGNATSTKPQKPPSFFSSLLFFSFFSPCHPSTLIFAWGCIETSSWGSFWRENLTFVGMAWRRRPSSFWQAWTFFVSLFFCMDKRRKEGFLCTHLTHAHTKKK